MSNLKNFTVNQAAKKLGVCTESIRRKIRTGEIAAVKNGKQYEISQDEINRLTFGKGEKIITIIDQLNNEGFTKQQIAKVVGIISGII